MRGTEDVAEDEDRKEDGETDEEKSEETSEEDETTNLIKTRGLSRGKEEWEMWCNLSGPTKVLRATGPE